MAHQILLQKGRFQMGTHDTCFLTGNKGGCLVFARGNLIDRLSAALEKGQPSSETSRASRTALGHGTFCQGGRVLSPRHPVVDSRSRVSLG